MIGDQPLVIAAIVCGLLAIKAVVLYLLARLFRIDRHHARDLGVVLAQGGEFAFVLFSVALEHHVLGRDLVDLLIGNVFYEGVDAIFDVMGKTVPLPESIPLEQPRAVAASAAVTSND